MAISLSRYVDITSGVGAASNVPTRSLGGLIVTGNPLVPTGVKLDFSDATDISNYFGSASEEALRGEFYFGWISKDITAPQILSFWNWNSAATGSLIFGAKGTYLLSTFTAITTGDFTLTLGGFTDHVTAINCSGDASLAAVAATIQTAIRAYSAGGVAWTAATVTYDSANSRFDLVSGTTGADTISITAGSSEDLAGPLGWLTGAILSNGAAAQTINTNLNNLINLSNNFGSFCYTTALALNQAQLTEAATWNNSLNPNIQFIFTAQCTASNSAALSAALLNIGGSSLTLAPLTTEYPEMVPMMILAATDYTRVNSVQNYMYQIFNLTPSVNDNTDANTYDNLRINYYGQTQTAGQLVQFYQRGFMFGLPVNPLDQNIYANEIWFKDAIGASLMNLLLGLAKVSANAMGRAQILGTLQSNIGQALFNGTISVGKTLTTLQQLYITQVTGDSRAWQQVQNAGFWVNVVIQSYVANGETQYKAVYTLVYSKDDDIRLIQGSNILI